MLKAKYKKNILETLSACFNQEASFFIFGSSLTRKSFDDIDIGMLNTQIDRATLSLLNEKNLRNLKCHIK